MNNHTHHIGASDIFVCTLFNWFYLEFAERWMKDNSCLEPHIAKLDKNITTIECMRACMQKSSREPTTHIIPLVDEH